MQPDPPEGGGVTGPGALLADQCGCGRKAGFSHSTGEDRRSIWLRWATRAATEASASRWLTPARLYASCLPTQAIQSYRVEGLRLDRRPDNPYRN